MSLSPSQRDLVRLLLEAGALQFGEFTLRSGRVSPYFFNIARFCTGDLLARLGARLAEGLERAAPGATIVFGPAYKGIPLAVAGALAWSERSGRPVGYLFDRKEAKTHGDVGRYVGRLPEPGDRLVLVDDVITDGETKRRAVEALRATFGEVPVEALVIVFNRMERSTAGADAVAAFEAATGVPVHALLSLAELEAALADGASLPGLPEPTAALTRRIRAYRERYGTPAGGGAPAP